MIDKTNKILELLQAFLEIKFENYIALHEFVEEHISNVQNEIEMKYAKIDEIEDVDIWRIETDKLLEDLGMQPFKFDHEFPNRIRYSAIIQTYSMLEVYLKRLCDRLKDVYQYPFGISDLKGSSDLEKGKLYLKRIYGIDFNELNPEWKFINDMRKIRNQIIHNNGDFTTNDTEIIKIIKHTEGLGFMWDDIEPELKDGQDYEIKIESKQLNETFVNNVKFFFTKIVLEIKKREIEIA